MNPFELWKEQARYDLETAEAMFVWPNTAMREGEVSAYVKEVFGPYSTLSCPSTYTLSAAFNSDISQNRTNPDYISCIKQTDNIGYTEPRLLQLLRP